MQLTDTFSHGDCQHCGLWQQYERGKTCLSFVPAGNFNGLMIVGEGPGNNEVVQNQPFVGQAGMYLSAFLDYAGVKREECYITNATRCLPPPKDKSLHEAFPSAIPACLGRLEAEIAAVRPRVIIPMGTSALIALTGYDKKVSRRQPIVCNECNTQRKVGPVIQCASCQHVYWLNGTCKEDVDPAEADAIRLQPCVQCGARLSRLRPKMIKCLTCGGRKYEMCDELAFVYDYKISEVAGAIFTAERQKTEPYHLDPWFRENGVRYIVPTYHPSFIARGNQFYAEPVVRHIKRAARLLTEDFRAHIDYEVTRGPDKVREFCLAPSVDGQPVNLAVDIETEATVMAEDGKLEHRDARVVEHVTKITCIGFARDGRALVVDTRDVRPDSPDDALLQALYDVLTNNITYTEKTYHNGMCYDIPVIDLVWGIPHEEQLPSYTDDTQTAHHVLYPDELHNLAHITFEMTDAQAWKPPKIVKGAKVHESFEELALYNARDVINTEAVRKALGVGGGFVERNGELDRAELAVPYNNDTKLNRIATKMFLRGAPLDLGFWDTVGERAQQELDKALCGCRDALANTRFPNPQEFNPFRVAMHLIPALYTIDGFNLPVIAQTKARQAATDAATLRTLQADAGPDGIRFLQAVQAARDNKKIISTYVEGQRPWDIDQRLHVQWKPYGTRTGRFSSSPNLQNWPKWLREAVKAPEGRVICGADYAQLELRAMAALSGDPELIRRCLTAVEERKFEPDYDPHSYVASVTFGETFTGLDLNDPVQAKKRSALRSLVKNVIYALNYGAGDKKIVKTIYSKGYDGPPVTVSVIQQVRKAIYSVFTQIPVWRDKQMEQVTKTAELRSPLHWRRRYFPYDDQMPVPPTEIYNYPIQSVAADIMNEAMIELDAALPAVDPSAFLFAQVHDSVYVEADARYAEPVCHLIEKAMTFEYSFGGPTMVFNATAYSSKLWKEAG